MNYRLLETKYHSWLIKRTARKIAVLQAAYHGLESPRSRKRNVREQGRSYRRMSECHEKIIALRDWFY